MVQLKSLFSRAGVQVLLVMFFLIVIRFWPLLVANKTLYFADNYSLMMPGKIFTAQWLRQGILPLWNPYIMAGLPWVGDVNQSVLYPSTLFFIWLAPAVALNSILIGHLVLAFLGMYWLARDWTKHQVGSVMAAVLWAGSTQVSGSINNLTTIQSIVWIPWLIWLGLRIGRDRWAPIWFALIVLLQFAGGYPQHVLYGIGMAGLFSAYRWWQSNDLDNWWQWGKAWSVTAFLSIALSSVIWVPFIDVLLHSTRMIQSSAQAAVGSLNPLMLVKLVSPYFFDKPTAGMKWGPAWSGQPNVVFYITWLGLGLIGSVITSAKTRKKDDWFFGIFCVVTLLFALGENIPGFGLLQQLLPLFRITRYPSMVLMLTNLTLALWVASALSRFKVTRSWFLVIGWGLGFSLFGSILAVVVSHWHFEVLWQVADQLLGFRLSSGQFHTLAKDQVIAQVIAQSWLMATLLTLGAVWALTQKRWWLLVIFMTIDLVYHTQAMFFFGPNSVYPLTGADSAVAKLVAPDPSYRWLTRNSNQPYTDYGSYWEAMVVRAPFSDSFVDDYELATTDHAQRLRDGLTPNWNMVYQVPTIHGYTSLLPQDFATLWESDGVVGINFIDQIKLENELLRSWAVRYYAVDTWFKVAEALPPEVVATTQQWQLYHLPALSRFRFTDDSAVSLLAFIETPNRLELNFENASNSASLRIADRYDRDWRAAVNGQSVTIQKSESMRLVPIEPGPNKVVLTYAPRWFWLGLSISLLTVSGILGWWWIVRNPLATLFKHR